MIKRSIRLQECRFHIFESMVAVIVPMVIEADLLRSALRYRSFGFLAHVCPE